MNHHKNDPALNEKNLKKNSTFKRAFFSFLSTGFILGCVVFVISIYFFIFHNLPSPESLKDYKAVPISTHIYDRNGKLLYEVYGNENRTPIKIKDLPVYVGQASIAIEDKDFYKHKGVSIISGILRAIKDTIIRKNLQGGSTITQQLVKGALLTSERSVQRKIKEIILATWVERIFKKEEILEMYLNQVPYGGSAYGIEEASKLLLGKRAKDLDIAEAALLAGLPQAPSSYSPYTNPDLAIQRRNMVLNAMYEQKYITKAQYDEAKKAKLNIIPPKVNIKAPHFVFFVKKQLAEIYGEELLEEGGLKITTTLDLDMQEEAEKIVKEEIEDLERLDVSNGAAMVMRPPTGEVLAMVGSVDYFASPSGSFNVVVDAKRQPGSTIKSLNYAIGIDREIVTPASIFLDTAVCFPSVGKPYCPQNYDLKFHGAVSLRESLANSYNIPAVKMLQMNGVREFIASAEAFTITTFNDPSRYGLALTLGGGEVPMYQMGQAFTAFANRGRPRKINYILKIEDKSGKEIYKFSDPNFVQDIKKPIKRPNYFAMTGPKAISEDTAFIISHIMQDNNARTPAFGANSKLVIPNKSVSVKTGTTNDYRDNWTIGYTPNFLSVVWVGNNDFSEMNQNLVSGVTGAAPIWNRIMQYALKNQPNLPPIKTAGVIGRQVCNDTGAVAGKSAEGYSCPTHFEYMIKGSEKRAKTLTAPSKMTIPVNKNTNKMTSQSDPDHEMREQTVIKDPGGSIFCVDCAQ